MKKYSRILWIGDTQAPAQHEDAYDFLVEIKREYKPDFVGHIGDEADLAAMSYHEKDPDLDNIKVEVDKAKKFLHGLERLFPEMVLIESNHGSLPFRKAKTAGIPNWMLRDYNDIWDVGPGWRWEFEYVVHPTWGPPIYAHHSKGDVLKLSQAMGMSAVSGHLHEKMEIRYWGSPLGLYFAAQTGALCDHHHLAMAYGKNNIKRPVLGSLMVEDGVPHLVSMRLDKHGRWIGRL